MTPFEAVPYEDQKRAMSLIKEQLLSNDAFSFDEKLLKYLQSEKRAAYSPRRGGNEDPQRHDLVLGLQGRAIAHILHPVVMKRLVDSSQYGNTYMPDEVLSDLFSAIFVQREMPTTFKMNLQSKYLDSLISALDDDSYDEISRSAIYASLVDIKDFTRIPYGDSKTKVHYRFLNWKATKALEN